MEALETVISLGMGLTGKRSSDRDPSTPNCKPSNPNQGLNFCLGQARAHYLFFFSFFSFLFSFRLIWGAFLLSLSPLLFSFMTLSFLTLR